VLARTTQPFFRRRSQSRDSFTPSCGLDGTVFSYYDALAGCVLTLLAGAAFAFLGAIIFGNPAPNLLVTFTQAFVLRGADGIQPPGTYLIETVEEPLDSVSFLGYRRVSTTITLPAVGTATLSKQVIAVSPQELKTGSINDGALAKE
jgi:hypothetical protein